MKFSIKVLFLSLLLSNLAYAQTASILPLAKTTFFDQNGKPLTSGSVNFYIPGTTTPKTTWQDAAETIPNLNPVVLDGAGRALILGSGSYRQIVRDRNNNLIWDQVTSSTGSGGNTPVVATGDGDLVGTIKPWAGLTAPNQYMFTYGQEVSRITFAALYNAITSTQSIFCTSGSAVLSGFSDTTNFPIGAKVEISCVVSGQSTIISKTTSTITLASNSNVSTNTNAIIYPWGNGNGMTTFNLPDFRGFAIAGNNNMGGAANSVLTTQFFGTNPNAMGAAGGSQSAILIAANLPPHTHTSSTLTDPGHTHNFIESSQGTSQTGAGGLPGLGGNNTGVVTSGPFATTTNVTGITISTNTGTNSSGTSTAFSLIQPTKTSNYIIKVTPDTNSATASGVTSLGGMTGDIACGSGLICTGNIISSTVLQPTIPQIPIENFGGSCSISDNTNALLTAVGSISGPVSILFQNNCTYPFAQTNAIVLNKAVLLQCSTGATLAYNPTGNGTFLSWSNGLDQLFAGGKAGINGCSLASSDTTFVKTMVAQFDVSGFYLNANIGWLTGGIFGGSGSICYYPHGRDTTTVSGNFQCDNPIHIGMNPHYYLSQDHFHYHDLYLIASAGFPKISVDPGVVFTSTTFDGYQSWNIGNYGFYYPGGEATDFIFSVVSGGTGYTPGQILTVSGGTCSTPITITVLTVLGGVIQTAAITNPGVCASTPSNPVSVTAGSATFTIGLVAGFNLSFNNVRPEQGSSNSAYNFYISPATTLRDVTITNSPLDSFPCGVFLKNVTFATIQQSTYAPISGGCGVAVNATSANNNDMVRYIQDIWITPVTQVVSGMNAVYFDNSPTTTSAAIPPNALYSSTISGTNISNLVIAATLFQSGVNGFINLSVPTSVSGTVNNVWGSVAGTLVASGTLPLVVNSTTGSVSCPTCATSTLNGAALTSNNDTNVTITLGGSPTLALLNAASISLGWTGNLSVARGGTGLASGTSGGIPYFSSSSSIASSAILVTNQIVLGGGIGGSPITLGSYGSTTTVLHGASGTNAPSFSAVANADLVNPSTTVNSQTCTLGSSCTITATASNTLTFGTHLTTGGTSYNGSAAVTITSDATAANTASTIMLRDGAGQVAATTFTGALAGNASTVTTNANLTGPIVSIGNTTSINSQTGTGSKFVVDTSPTIITPTFTTSFTSPLHIGGSGTTGTQLTLQTTTGNGTTDQFSFIGGNNGASQFGLLSSAGLVIGSTLSGLGTTLIGAPAPFSGAANGGFILGGLRYNGGGTIGAAVSLASTRATSPGSFSAVQAGDGLGGFVFAGDNSANYLSRGATIRAAAVTNWTGSFNDAKIVFAVTATGAATPTDAVTIQQSGGLSIGTTTDPLVGGLQVNGQTFIPNASSDSGLADSTACLRTSNGQILKGSGTLGICLGTSSERYKRDIIDLSDGLKQLVLLEPKNFFYKQGFGDNGIKEQYGFIAEDVIKVFPKLVGIDNEQKPSSVDILGMVPILVNSMKQLKAENDNLKACQENWKCRIFGVK